MINIIIFLLFITPIISSLDTTIIQKLTYSRDYIDQQVNNISTEWQIEHYPNFLCSMGTTRSDWDSFINKLKVKIMKSITTTTTTTTTTRGGGGTRSENFVICFMGSSVTAGHDSLIKQSFPNIIKEIIYKSLKNMNINLIIRNVAMGNNPCMPYNICVKTFCGHDVIDIVHWEQSYNCGFGDNQRILEQFFRQIIVMSNNPLIVFTDSTTPNWRKVDCPVVVDNKTNSDMKQYLDIYKEKNINGVVDIVTNHKMNKKSIYRKFGYLNHIVKKYKDLVSVQLWDHSLYEVYKCQGPYVSDWQGRNAKWHPSVNGHKLRAAHHSFFWLVALSNAITSLLNDQPKNIENMSEKDEKTVDEIDLPLPLVVSNISDNIQCFTNYEPRTERQNSLHAIIVGGRAIQDFTIDLTSTRRHSDKGTSTDSIGWHTELYEALVAKKNIPMISKMGHLDFKVVMYGNAASGPLSFLITTRHSDGNIFICEAPGIWGKMMNGYTHLYESSLEVFVTNVSKDNIDTSVSFNFRQEHAIKMEYSHSKVDELCIQLLHKLPLGRYVLTIIPRSNKRVTIATLLIP